MTDLARAPLQQASAKPAIEADASAGFWRKSPTETLPPPDMVGPYMRNRPVSVEPVEGRRA
jgi:oleate hydratase